MSRLKWSHFSWGPFFITWVVRSAMTRYDGAGLLKRVQPFFMRLFVGDAMISGVYALLNWLIHLVS